MIEFNNQLDIAGKAINIPLLTGLGYYNGTQIGQGLGFNQGSQKRLGRISALNAGLNSSATLFNTLNKRKEVRNRQNLAHSQDYVNQTYDRYAYNPYSNSQYEGNNLKHGGIPTSKDGLYDYPNQPVNVPSGRITMKDIDYPVQAYPNGDAPQLMLPNKEYNFPNSTNVLEVPQLKLGGSKEFEEGENHIKNFYYQEGGVVYDSTPNQGNTAEVFDSTLHITKDINPYSVPLEFPQEVPQNYNNPDAPKGGSIAVSHNNPGNIKMGNYASQYGATPGRRATDGGVFALFPDVDTGLKAQRDLLQGKNYRDLSVDKAMRRWSNSGYGGELYPSVATKKMNELTETELLELQRRQIKREDINMYKLIYDA